MIRCLLPTTKSADDQGVLVETAEKIADEISERMDAINGLRAPVGVRCGFVDSITVPKSMRLRGLIAANDTTALSRIETSQGQAVTRAWRFRFIACTDHPRGWHPRGELPGIT